MDQGGGDVGVVGSVGGLLDVEGPLQQGSGGARLAVGSLVGGGAVKQPGRGTGGTRVGVIVVDGRG
jgi:hypothetical protein